MNQRDWNATLGVLGVTVLSIFASWFPIAVLDVPMPEGIVASTALSTGWEALVGVVLPYLWAMRRLGFRLGDLGLKRENLARSTALGCAVYLLALVAFLHCSGGSMMAEHTLRKVTLVDAVLLVPLMGLLAVGTDLGTRGFILLTLARHTHVVFAIFMQNLVWFLGHIYEIGYLADCLGIPMAAALTLALGILGDMVVLRTRNVVGLAVAHLLLNLILSVYLRYM